MQRHSWWVVGVMVMAAGCVEEEGAERSPEKLHTGAYAVTVTTMEDSCAPQRKEGGWGTIDVFVYDGGKSVEPMVPDELPGGDDGDGDGGDGGGGSRRVALTADARYQLIERSEKIFGMECGGAARMETRLSLAEADESGLTLRRWTSWSVVKQCSDGTSAEMPAASCAVKQDLRYELVKTCEAPCKLWTRGDGEYECQCQ